MAKITIDGKEVDYNESDVLPFSIAFKTDPFFKIGETTGYELQNLANRLRLEPSANNISILKKGLQEFKAVAFGKEFFTGKSLKTETIKNGSITTDIGITIFGGNYEFFHLFNELYLDELNLGSQLWNDTSIRNSWTTGNNTTGVFAPVVYGKLKDDTIGFQEEDLRFHVYFYRIISEIFNSVGFQFESDFFESDYFKKIAFLYSSRTYPLPITTTKANMKINADKNIDVSLPVEWDVDDVSGVLWNSSTNKFTSNIEGDYTITTTIQTDANYKFSVGLWLNNVKVLSFPCGVPIMHTIALKVGDVFFIQLETTNSNPNGVLRNSTFLNNLNTQLLIENQLSGVGEEFIVSSCLPSVSSKVFLKDITKMFNLVWFVDNQTKKAKVEPRFDWNGSTGFYKKPVLGSQILDISDKRTEKHEESLVKSVVFNFKNTDDALIKGINEQPNNSNKLEIYSAKVNISDVFETISLDLFEVLINAPVRNISSSENLPVILDKDAEYKDGLQEPTFKAGSKLGFVHENDVIIKYKGSNETVPLISQIKDYNGNCLCFGDNELSKGLISVFYPLYFNIIKDNTILDAEIWRNSLEVINEDFQTLVSFDNDFWILISIIRDISKPSIGNVQMVRYSEMKESLNVTGNIPFLPVINY